MRCDLPTPPDIATSPADAIPVRETANLLREAEALLRKDPAQALELATTAAFAAQLEGDPEGAAYGFCLSGYASLYLGDVGCGLEALRQARRLGRELLRDAGLKIRITNGLGIALHQLGRYAEADRAFDRALAAARRRGHRVELVRCLTNVGTAKSEAGRHEESLACFTEALEVSLAEAGGLAEKAAYLPVLLCNLGTANQCLGRHAEALALFDRSAAAARDREDYLCLAKAHGGRGETLLLLDRGEEAEDALAEALSICLRLGANLAGIHVALILARRALDSGELDEAEAVIEEWLPRSAAGDSIRHAEMARLQGRLLALRGRWREAYEAGERAGEFERKAGSGSATNASLDVERGRYARRTRRLAGRVADWNEAVMMTLAALIEAKDAPTGRHVDRAAEIVRRLGERVIADGTIPCLDGQLLAAIVRSTPLHDIGKIAVPDSILGKPGPLDPEERAAMQRHVAVGEQILLDAARRVRFEPRVKVAAEIAGCHHERWDGRGYPAGLQGKEIPLAARIVAVADVYDAIRSERPYKPAFSREIAFAYIADNAGLHFDPRIVAAFIACEGEIASLYAS
ncbi:MAG: tetratricopeptide repeat protein [Spirochaetaceae bacterium]|nr:tetratricopeptide repeat protein [Spirochaetaceae bacterium]